LRRTRRRAAWNRFARVRGDSRQGGTSAASPMRAYLTIAAVISQGPTSDQLTDGPYPNKAKTCPDVSESRHSVAVTGVGGVNDADNH